MSSVERQFPERDTFCPLSSSVARLGIAPVVGAKRARAGVLRCHPSLWGAGKVRALWVL